MHNKTSKTMNLTRRTFFRWLSAAPALASAAADDKLIVRSANPEDFEMPLAGFTSWITPVDRFFVRTHVYRPAVDAAQWRLRIGGLVDKPVALDMAELRKLPRVELVSVLECAGNGRSFYQPIVAGMQWRYGAVGNARWAGVRLADVLRRAGIKPGAKHIGFNGADVPLGTMPDFVRSLPVDKSLRPDTLLAYEMNGQPLTPSHGFPMRLIVPGWAGDSWVKWVTDIEAREKEQDGFFMQTAYRRPMHTVAPGTAVEPAQMTPVTGIRPKSVIAEPVDGQRIQPGQVTIRGAAWAGESPVAHVDVSMDNGRTWHAARLGADKAKYAWRLWEADWAPSAPGSYVLMAQASDEAGEKQPFAADWNPSGYLYNVVQQVRVEVGGSGAPAFQPAAKIPEFPPKVKASCVGCHREDMTAGQRLTRAQWDREVDKMVRWGAQVKPEDRAQLLDFLSSHFPPR
jgi:DMSO/TMAO reductase YedYZ molybdopterin-dependent catalytic subunit